MTAPLHPDLERWLDEASKDLEPIARERIEREIVEHYQDAFQDFRSRGLELETAHSEAFAAIGPAQEARRKYFNVYFPANFSEQLGIFNTFASFACVSSAVYLYLQLDRINYGYFNLDRPLRGDYMYFITQTLHIFSPAEIFLLFILIANTIFIYIRVRLYFSIKSKMDKYYIYLASTSYIVVPLFSCTIFLRGNNISSEFLVWFMVLLQPILFYPSFQLLHKYARRQRALA